MVKIIRSSYIELELWLKAKEKKVNMSLLFNNALKNHLKITENEVKEMEQEQIESNKIPKQDGQLICGICNIKFSKARKYKVLWGKIVCWDCFYTRTLEELRRVKQ
jgi:formylmethanofuran dehydrogenase subunit E